MRPQLRHRIGLYAPSRVSDDIGGTVTQWRFERALWAGVEPRGLSERIEDGRRVATQTFRVTLRYRTDLPRQSRLMWRGRQLRVIAASDPDTRGERLHLICESVT